MKGEKNSKDMMEKNFLLVGSILLVIGGLFLFVCGGVAILRFVVFRQDILPGSEEALAGMVLMLVFGILGGLLAGGGSYILWLRKKQMARIEALRREGVMVMADLLDCEPDYSLVINGRPTYTLRCCWKSPQGQAYIFTRRHLQDDPVPLLAQERVKVYYERNHMDNYFVDIEASKDPRITEL